MKMQNIQVESSMLLSHIFKMSSSPDRTSLGGLSGKFCSALWSRAATLNTVGRAPVTSEACEPVRAS